MQLLKMGLRSVNTSNGTIMKLSKYLVTTLFMAMAAFMTYHAVAIQNCIEATNFIQKVARMFTIFSIIYACGKLVPLASVKVMNVIGRFAKFISHSR